MCRLLQRWIGCACLLWGAPFLFGADPLDIWTSQGGASTNLLQNIAYGNGLFVAAGYNGTIITSPDGTRWTEQTSGTSESLYTITFGGDLFVAAGSRGTIIVSSDGVTWSGINSGTENPLFGSAYGDGTYLVVGGSNVLASANGVQWVPRLSPVLPRAYLNAVTYGAGRFVAVGAGLRGLWSTNTIDWTASESMLGNLFDITHGNGLFVAVGGGFGGFGEVASSTDGVLWNSLPLLTFASAVDVAYGNGRFLALGLFVGAPPPFSSELLFESRDAIDWATRTLPTPVGLYGMTYADSRFYSVGAGGSVLRSGSFAPASLQFFGLPGTNGVELRITGEVGRPYRLQFSPDAGGTNWQDLLIFTNPIDTDTVVKDLRAVGQSRRFYRVLSP